MPSAVPAAVQTIPVSAAAQVAYSAGSNNIAIGYSVASTTLNTGSNNILIGTNSAVDTPLPGTNNFLNIGNLIYGTSIGTAASPGFVGIGTASPIANLDVTGTTIGAAAAKLRISGTDASGYAATIRMTNGNAGGADAFITASDSNWVIGSNSSLASAASLAKYRWCECVYFRIGYQLGFGQR